MSVASASRTGVVAAFARRVGVFVAAAALAGCAFLGPDDPRPRIALDTTLGRIVIECDAGRAPVTTKNFLRYVKEGHYDGTTFHRVVADFVVQGGGHEPSMRERPTHDPIENEAGNGLTNRAGTVAMARETAIDSATAQFFINVVDNPRLDHVEVPPDGVTVTRNGRPMFVKPEEADLVYGYAVFGRVVEGMDVVERMRAVPVHTVGEYQNVPITPVIIRRASVLART